MRARRQAGFLSDVWGIIRADDKSVGYRVEGGCS